MSYVRCLCCRTLRFGLRARLCAHVALLKRAGMSSRLVQQDVGKDEHDEEQEQEERLHAVTHDDVRSRRTQKLDGEVGVGSFRLSSGLPRQGLRLKVRGGASCRLHFRVLRCARDRAALASISILFVALVWNACTIATRRHFLERSEQKCSHGGAWSRGLQRTRRGADERRRQVDHPGRGRAFQGAIALQRNPAARKRHLAAHADAHPEAAGSGRNHNPHSLPECCTEGGLPADRIGNDAPGRARFTSSLSGSKQAVHS